MGDECTCEKCQAVSFKLRGVSAWPVTTAETQGENHAHPSRELYLIVSDGGISLRQHSFEF